MAISVIDQISYKGKKQNFSRDSFDTIAEMVAFREIYLPPIFEAFCYEDRKKYKYDETNEIDPVLGKWRVSEVNSEGQENKIESISLNEEPLAIDENKNVNIDLSDYALKTDIVLKSVSVDGVPLEIDEEGNVDIDIPDDMATLDDIKIDSISVDGEPVEIDEDKNVNIDLSGKVDVEDGKSLISEEDLEQITLNKEALLVLNGIGEGSVAKQVADGVSASMKMKKIIVTEVPSVDEAEDNVIYMVKEPGEEWYNMYMKVVDINEMEQVTFTGTTETKYVVLPEEIEYQNEKHLEAGTNVKDNLDAMYDIMDANSEAIEALQEDNIQPDWEQEDEEAADFIKNKPEIPEVPIKGITVNEEEVEPDEDGIINISIPDAPIQSISVNGEKVEPDDDGNVAIEIPDAPVQSIYINETELEPDDDGKVTIPVDEELNATSENPVQNKVMNDLINGDEEVDGSVAQKIRDNAQNAKSGLQYNEITYTLDLPETLPSIKTGLPTVVTPTYTITEITSDEYDSIMNETLEHITVGSFKANGNNYEVRLVKHTDRLAVNTYYVSYAEATEIEATPVTHDIDYTIKEAFDTKADKADIPEVPIKTISINDIPLEIDEDGNVDIAIDESLDETSDNAVQNKVITPLLSGDKEVDGSIENKIYNKAKDAIYSTEDTVTEGYYKISSNLDTDIVDFESITEEQYESAKETPLKVGTYLQGSFNGEEVIKTPTDVLLVVTDTDASFETPSGLSVTSFKIEYVEAKTNANVTTIEDKIKLIDKALEDAEADTKQYTDDQLKQTVTDKLAQPDGIATLDSNGQIPASQLSIEAMEYKGQWDPNSGEYPETTETSKGDVWFVSAAGKFDDKKFVYGDRIIYNGDTWDHIHSGEDNLVTSVNTFKGDVILKAEHIDYKDATDEEPAVTIKSELDSIEERLIVAGKVDTVNGQTPDENKNVVVRGEDIDVSTKTPRKISEFLDDIQDNKTVTSVESDSRLITGNTLANFDGSSKFYDPQVITETVGFSNYNWEDGNDVFSKGKSGTKEFSFNAVDGIINATDGNYSYTSFNQNTDTKIVMIFEVDGDIKTVTSNEGSVVYALDFGDDTAFAVSIGDYCIYLGRNFAYEENVTSRFTYTRKTAEEVSNITKLGNIQQGSWDAGHIHTEDLQIKNESFVLNSETYKVSSEATDWDTVLA